MASLKITELTEINTCKICDNALAKYTCPRCNILYCSLLCYQANSHLECSEDFYKEIVLNELGSDEGGNDSKTKMLEILKKTHEINETTSSIESTSDNEESYKYLNFENFETMDSDDDEDCGDIADRLAGVDLDNSELVWEKLTEDEKQEFVAFLKSEDVSKLIPSWQPWWLNMNETKIIDMSKEDCKTQYPKMYPVKDFCQITAKPPAECIKYNLVNILAAYVFTTRYFNGEHFHFAKEAVSCIATLSSNLKNIHNFDDFETAVKHAEQQCFNSTWILTDAENIQTMRDDLHKILQGPNDLENKLYIMYALSDMHHLFEESLKPINDTATSTFEAKFSNNHFPAVELEPSDKIKKYIKKIEYYLSYTKDCYNS